MFCFGTTVSFKFVSNQFVEVETVKDKIQVQTKNKMHQTKVKFKQGKPKTWKTYSQ